MSTILFVCRECRRNSSIHSRGLCRRCFRTPSILARYPAQSVYIPQAEAGRSGCAGLPEPTSAIPGSDEKIAILAERASKLQELHHPLDVRHEFSCDDISHAVGDPISVRRGLNLIKAVTCTRLLRACSHRVV